MVKAVIVTVDLIKKLGEKENLIRNKLERVPTDVSLRSVYEGIIAKRDVPVFTDELKVFVSPKLTRSDEIEVDCDEALSLVAELIEPKSIYFVATRSDETTGDAAAVVPVAPNPFALMMGVSVCRLAEMKGSGKKVELHNKVLNDMQGSGGILRGRVSQKDGEDVFKKLTNALWWLDGRKEKINAQSRKRKIEPTPERFNAYSKYQDWVKWKKKPRLTEDECKIHSSNLIDAIEDSSIIWPTAWKDDIVELSSSVSSYATWLQGSNKDQKSRQSQLHPVRTLTENAEGQYWPSVERGKVHNDLSFLSQFMEDSDEFEPVLVEDEHFAPNITPSRKYYLMTNIA